MSSGLKYYTFEEFKKLTLTYGSIFCTAPDDSTNTNEQHKSDSTNAENKSENNSSNRLKLETKLNLFIGKYKLISVLSQGFFGKIIVAKVSRSTPSEAHRCILKVQKLTSLSIGQIATEWEALKRVAVANKNSFIVKLLSCCQTNGHAVFSMEYLNSGTLREVVVWQERLEEVDCCFYMACLVIALHHLHSLNISHGDLKLQNIMLDAQQYPKLIDLGHARVFHDKDNLDSINNAFLKDFTKLAKCLYEMLTGDPLRVLPMHPASHLESLKHCSDRCIEFLKLTSNEEELRKTWKERSKGSPPQDTLSSFFLKHPFFQDIQWNKVIEKKATAPVSMTRAEKNRDDSERLMTLWREMEGCEKGPRLEGWTGDKAEEVTCHQED